MTALAAPPKVRSAGTTGRRAPDPTPRSWRPEAPLVTMTLITVGLIMMAIGVVFRSLVGNTLVHGVFMGGVALVIAAPFTKRALEVIVILSPFMTYMFGPGGTVLTMGASDALFPFIVGAMVATAVLGRRTLARAADPERLRAAWPLLIFAIVLAMGSIAIWTNVSPGFLTGRAITDTAKLAIGVGYLIVVYLLCKAGGPAVVQRALWFWTWTATALSLGSLLGITGAILIVPSDGYRSEGFFEDPNVYAGYLLVSFSIVLYLATLSNSGWLPVQGLLLTGGVVMTGSRAGMGSLVLLVVFALLVLRSARLRGMLIGIVVLGGGLLGLLMATRDSGTSILGIDRLFFAQDVGNDPRLGLWQRAIEKWSDAPIWGIGAGQFERFSGDVFRVANSTGFGYVTHNTFLFFLVAFGVIGLGLFLGMIGWIVYRLYTAPGMTRVAQHSLMTGVVVLGSQFMTLNLQNLRYVWVFFGLLLGLSVVSRQKQEPDPAEAVP